MKTLLLTGGLGYIGSHAVVVFLEQGYDVIVLDNCSNTDEQVLDSIHQITGKTPKFYKTDLRDKTGLEQVFSENSIDGVIHFAGAKAVGESCEKPFYYYENNILGSLNLFEVMDTYGVRDILFSSSANVYGQEGISPFQETHNSGDTSNPYGTTKYIIERILRDLYTNNSFNVMILRYFNPVGAHPSGYIGEHANQKLGNILPFLLKVANGQQEKIQVYGNDYNTPDGTGVRDYIHVMDLVEGHIAAYEYMGQHPGLEILNLGTGHGTSVMELITIVQEQTGRDIPYEIVGRREIDIAEAYCCTEKAEKTLGWKAKRTVDEAVRDSWNFIQTSTPHIHYQAHLIDFTESLSVYKKNVFEII